MAKKIQKPIDIFEPTKEQVNDLKIGINQPFWETLKSILIDEKKTAELMVFENEELTNEQRDDLRLRRNLLQYVIELPELVIEKSRPKQKQKEPDYEVYA